MAHLFGPVPSRRLGRSLGVDLIPPKTCPYDCIYCEVGPTTRQTRRRFAYRIDAIIKELSAHLRDPDPAPRPLPAGNTQADVRITAAAADSCVRTPD